MIRDNSIDQKLNMGSWLRFYLEGKEILLGDWNTLEAHQIYYIIIILIDSNYQLLSLLFDDINIEDQNVEENLKRFE